MKKQDLYNFRYLKIEIARIEKRIAEVEDAAFKTVSGGGGGRSSGVSDKVGNNAVKLADLNSQLKKYKQRKDAEECAIMAFVEGLESARLRVIIQLHFIDCKSWEKTAVEIGGRATENSCKQYFKRKMKELEGV